MYHHFSCEPMSPFFISVMNICLVSICLVSVCLVSICLDTSVSLYKVLSLRCLVVDLNGCQCLGCLAFGKPKKALRFKG